MNMRIPILKLGDTLIVSIQWELDDQNAIQFQEDLLNKLHSKNASGVLIDLTPIDFIDSFIAKVLGDVINMSRLMGAKVVITGIQPAVAITLIELGIRLENVMTALDLENGLDKLHNRIGGLTMECRSSVDIYTEWDIVAARQLGRNEAKNIGFGTVDQARITTAISELARNIYLYAGKGNIKINELYENNLYGISIIASDEGPGIADLRKVMNDGYSTSGGLGAGMPGVRRLMDEFNVQSEKGVGTTITAVKWLR